MNTVKNAYARPKLVKRTLIFAVFMLACMHILSVLLARNGSGSVLSFANVFDLDQEWNVPTLYSGFVFASSALFCLIHAAKPNVKSVTYMFIGLSVFFLYMAFDETLVVHESFAEPIRNYLGIGDGNVFYHAWVLPAIAILGLVGGMYVLLRAKGKEAKLLRHVVFSIGVLGVGVVLLEMAGTQLYFSQTVYKLGPVMLEELYELSLSSYILYKLHSTA